MQNKFQSDKRKLQLRTLFLTARKHVLNLQLSFPPSFFENWLQRSHSSSTERGKDCLCIVSIQLLLLKPFLFACTDVFLCMKGNPIILEIKVPAVY